MPELMMSLWRKEDGQDLTEYALLLVLVALVALAALQAIGSSVSNVFSNAATNMSTTSS